jgi:hypothetical protein
MAKNKKLNVKGIEVTISTDKNGEYISLTDMMKAKDGDFFISDWLRNRNTVEFLGIWESVNNPNFNYGEFAIIKSKAGLNYYKISVQEWTEKTNAIGLRASRGRYGGTYAHIDIALEFGMWISAEFKVYLIQEYKRLKQEENNRQKLDWNLQRTLAKVNYTIHTDAIKERLIPERLTAEWRSKYPENKGNIRDNATLEQLVVLSNLESINAVLIRQGISPTERLHQLNNIAITQMTSLVQNANLKKLK